MRYIRDETFDCFDPSDRAVSTEATDKIINPNPSPVSWISKIDYQDMIQQFHIFFRFKDTCIEPAAVGGRLCWTTTSTQIRSIRRPGDLPLFDLQILVTYRTINTRERSSFVYLHDLINASPTLKDLAYVCEGHCKGDIFKVAQFIREDHNPKHVIGAKLYKDGTSKTTAQPFHLLNITRLMCLEQGPP